jgi:hypothetical protein
VSNNLERAKRVGVRGRRKDQERRGGGGGGGGSEVRVESLGLNRSHHLLLFMESGSERKFGGMAEERRAKARDFFFLLELGGGGVRSEILGEIHFENFRIFASSREKQRKERLSAQREN